MEEPCLQEVDLEARLWEDLSAKARERLRLVLEAAMQSELNLHLGYEPYWRDPQVHTSCRNGCYRRGLDTQFGPIRGLRVSRPRQGCVDYQALERYSRRAPWVNQLVQEMFIAGVSTRRARQIMEGLLEASVSESTVSRIYSRLQEQVRAGHGRRLQDNYQYLDSRWHHYSVKTAHGAARFLVLCIYGITPEGRREMLDYLIGKSEAEAERVALLQDLYARLAGRKGGAGRTNGGQASSTRCSSSFPGCRCSAAGRINCAM